jgi:hypothetical protein
MTCSARMFCLWILVICSSTALGEPFSEPDAPAIDSQARLDDALKQARAEQKRVFILETGENCGHCIFMARFLERYKSTLSKDFIVLAIERRQDGVKDPVISRIRAGKPGGIPWSAILDENGTVLTTSNKPDGKNLGFPHEQPDIDYFIEMLKTKSGRISRSELNEMAISLERQTIVFEYLKERQAAETAAAGQVETDDK